MTVTETGSADPPAVDVWIDHFLRHSTVRRPLLLICDVQVSRIAPSTLQKCSDTGWQDFFAFIDFFSLRLLLLLCLFLTCLGFVSSFLSTDIICIALPMASHHRETIDISAKPVLSTFNELYKKSFTQVDHMLNAREIAELACQQWSAAFSPKNVQETFEINGVFPFSREVVGLPPPPPLPPAPPSAVSADSTTMTFPLAISGGLGAMLLSAVQGALLGNAAAPASVPVSVLVPPASESAPAVMSPPDANILQQFQLQFQQQILQLQQQQQLQQMQLQTQVPSQPQPQPQPQSVPDVAAGTTATQMETPQAAPSP